MAGGMSVATSTPNPRDDAWFYTPVTGVWEEIPAPAGTFDITSGIIASVGNMAYFGRGAKFESGFPFPQPNMYSVDAYGAVVLLGTCDNNAFHREDGVLVAMPLDVGCVVLSCAVLVLLACLTRLPADVNTTARVHVQLSTPSGRRANRQGHVCDGGVRVLGDDAVSLFWQAVQLQQRHVRV